MDIDSGLLLNFMVALGIGLLIGAEREHNQPPEENGTAIAGVRTFTIAALLGAASITFDFWLLAVALACVALFSVTASSQKSKVTLAAPSNAAMVKVRTPAIAVPFSSGG